MARWEPKAQERLQQAALELFQERGYAGTTVEEIALRAGLTARTFFRHFTDKREVLFGGSEHLQALLVEAIAHAPATATPLEAVAASLAAAATALEGRHAHAKARKNVIAAHPELLERELMKLAALTFAMTEALRQRGVAEPLADLAAETGMAIFKVGFRRWVDEDAPPSFARCLQAALADLKVITAGPGAISP